MLKPVKKWFGLGLLSSLLTLPSCATQLESAQNSVADSDGVSHDTPQALPPQPLKAMDGASFFHLLLAELALMNEAPEAALEFYLAVWEEYPNDAGLLQVLAPLAARLGNPQLALRLYENWAEAEPNRREIWHGLWQIGINQKAPEPASLAIEQLLKLNPDYDLNVPYQSILNWSPDEARAFYEALTERHIGLSERSDGLYLLGFLQTQAQQLAAASAYWQKLSEQLIHPDRLLSFAQSAYDVGFIEASAILMARPIWRDNPSAVVLYARILRRQDNPESALDWLLSLPSSGEVNPELLRFKAELAVATDHPQRDEWLAMLLETAEADSARLLKAEVLLSNEDPIAARQWLNDITDPSLVVNATTLLINSLQQSPLSEAAVAELFEQWRHKHPNAPIRMLEQQARHWYDEGFYERAYDAYSLGLRTQPNDFFFLYMRALSAEPLDRLETLEQDLRRILMFDPNNTAALNALGYTLIDRTDRIEEAAPMIEQAYAQNPESFAITDSLGWLRFKQGRYAEAVEILARAVSMQDTELDDDEVVSHYVEALWRNGDIERAASVAQDWIRRFQDTQRLQSLLERLGIKY